VRKRVYVICLLAFAYSNSFAQKAGELNWILGTWKINTSNGIIIESWKTVNDSTLQGRNYFIKTSNDTIPQESLELTFRKGEWVYIPTVKGQNNDQPVSFKIIFIGKNEFISENPSHDFPQRISYRRIKALLFASIEGRRKGKYSKQNFDFSEVE